MGNLKFICILINYQEFYNHYYRLLLGNVGSIFYTVFLVFFDSLCFRLREAYRNIKFERFVHKIVLLA
jgi:hypothetical protein